MRCNSNRAATSACVVSSETCRITLLNKAKRKFIQQKRGKAKRRIIKSVIQRKRQVDRVVVKSQFFTAENVPFKKTRLDLQNDSKLSKSSKTRKLEGLPQEIISKIGFLLPADSFQVFRSTSSTISNALTEDSYYKHMYTDNLWENCLEDEHMVDAEFDLLQNDTNLILPKQTIKSLKSHFLTREKSDISMLNMSYLSTLQSAPKEFNIYGISKVVVTRSTLHVLTKNKQIFCLQLTRGAQLCSLRNSTFTSKKGSEVHNKTWFEPNYFQNDILDICTANGNSPCTRQYLYVLRKGDGRGNIIEVFKDSGIKKYDKKFFVTCNESTKLTELKVATSDERTASDGFKNLVVLKTEIGQLFTLALEEARLSDLGAVTESVTLKLLTSSDFHGKVAKYETRDGIIAIINEHGKLFISCQRVKDLHNIFGRFHTTQNSFSVRTMIPLGKDCVFRDVSVGNKHVVCVDTLDRVFGIGVNNVGQVLFGKRFGGKLRSLTRVMKSFSGFEKCSGNNRVRFVQCGQDCTVFCVENLDKVGNVRGCFLVYRGRREHKYKKIMPRVDRNAKQILLVQDVVFVASNYDAEQCGAAVELEHRGESPLRWIQSEAERYDEENYSAENGWRYDEHYGEHYGEDMDFSE